MKMRSLLSAALSAAFILGAASPAFADPDGWRRHERREREWREHAWREHTWREHAWREHAWREHAWREHQMRPRYQETAPTYYYAPPVVVFRFGGPR